MDVLMALVSLALTIFVLVAIGQLFAIKKSLQRLVAVAESQATTAVTPNSDDHQGLAALTRLSDPELIAAWNSGRKEPEVEREMKQRGMYVDRM